MPLLKIDGVGQVQVDDSFLKMPRDQQDAFVAHIADNAKQGVKAGGGEPVGASPSNPSPPQAPRPAPIAFDETGLSSLDDALKAPASPMPYGQQMANVAGFLGRGADRAVRTAADGMTFGLADRLAAGGDTLTKGGTYAGNLAQERAATDAVGAGVPGLNTALRVGGGLVTGGALAKGGLSLAANLPKGAGLMARLLGFGGDGAIAGATDAVGHKDSGSLGDYADTVGHGAAFGFGAGALLPVAGAVAGKAVSAASPFFAKPLEGMGRTTTGLLGALMTPRAANALDTLGPDASLVDASPSLLGLGQGVAAKPGPGADMMTDFVNARHEGQSDRLVGDLNANLGPAFSPQQIAGTVDDNVSRYVRPKYAAALDGMPPLDISHVLDTLGRSRAAEGTPEAAAVADARRSLTQPAPESDLRFDPTVAAPITGQPRPMPPVDAYLDPITPTRPGAPRPQTLQDFVKAAGGIQDRGGDLKAMGFDAIRGMIAKPGQGLGADAMRQAAAQAGFLGADVDHAMANTTPNNLFAALEAHPVHSAYDEGTAHAWNAYDRSRDEAQGVGSALGRSARPPQAPIGGNPIDPAAPLAGRIPISDPRTILSAKKAMDDHVTWGPGGAQVSSAVKDAQGVYAAARSGLNDAMEAASPDFAAANLGYRTAHRAKDAFDVGRGVLRGGDAAPWPDDFDRALAALPLEQQAMVRSGARSDIEQRFGQNRNDLSALLKVIGGENDFNRANMGTLFGPTQTQAMVDAAKREQVFANSRNAIAAGSRTAPMQAGSKAIDDATAARDYVVPKDATIMGLLLHGAEHAARKGAGMLGAMANDTVRGQLGGALSATGSEAQQIKSGLLAILAERARRSDAVRSLLANPGAAPAIAAGRRNGR